MAIATVAATKIQGSGASASGAVPATAGNSLIVAGAMYNTAAWSVARTGDTFTVDINGRGTAVAGVGISSAPNVVGGSVTCTVTCTSATGITAYACEVSGLPTSAIRDAASPAIANANSASAVSGSLSNVTADAIYFGVITTDAGLNPETYTPTGGWSDVIGGTTMKEVNNASFQGVDVVFQIVSSAAARTATWTITSGVYTAAIAVYKAAAAGGGAGLPFPMQVELLTGGMQESGGVRQW